MLRDNIKNSHLYKKYKEAFNDVHPFHDFANQIEIAIQYTLTGGLDHPLTSAFQWNQTPQGFQFWSVVDKRHKKITVERLATNPNWSSSINKMLGADAQKATATASLKNAGQTFYVTRSKTIQLSDFQIGRVRNLSRADTMRFLDLNESQARKVKEAIKAGTLKERGNPGTAKPTPAPDEKKMSNAEFQQLGRAVRKPMNQAELREISKAEMKPKDVLHYVVTPMNVCFSFNGEQHTVDISHPKAAEIITALMAGEGRKAVDMLDVAQAIRTYMKGHVKVEGGVITYKGMVITGGMTDRIIDAMGKGEEEKVNYMVAFFNNLMENPSNRAVNELFGFLEANDIEITEDGYFYAWKKVRGDYLDIYTGKMSNAPGVQVEVPRNMVDEDSTQTCSYGLHVCSKSYLNHYGSSIGNRVVKCKVHPRDVVAIPSDYNNAKMRCSGYYVVEDVTGKI